MKSTLVIQFAQRFTTLPNQLTGIRFVAVPIMWVFAFQNEPAYVGVGLIVALVTDALDGHTARALNLVSEFGAKFDSLADILLTVSAVVWILMLKPEIASENLGLSLAAAMLYMVALLVGWLKFEPLAYLDLYSAKAAAFVEYVFLVHAFLFGRYNQVLFYLAIGMLMVSCVETIMLRLTQSRADEPIKSVVFSLATGKPEPPAKE